MSKSLITCREAASILDVSDETVRRWFHQGALTGVRLNGHAIRVHVESVNAMLGIADAKGGAA